GGDHAFTAGPPRRRGRDARSSELQRAQERVERRAIEAAEREIAIADRRRLAAMSGDRGGEGRRASGLQVGSAAGDAPQGRGPELASLRVTLLDAVAEPRPHVVQEEIRERAHTLAVQGMDRARTGAQPVGVAGVTLEAAEDPPSGADLRR